MTRFNGQTRRVACAVDRGSIFLAISDSAESTLLFFRGGTIGRWERGEDAVSSTWQGFNPVSEHGVPPRAFLLRGSKKIVVHDSWFTWVWSLDGHTHYRMRPGAEIYSIAALPAERLAVGCRDGRVHILKPDLTPEASCVSPDSAWDLTATESELIVGQMHALSFVDFAGAQTRPSVLLPAMLLRLGAYGRTVLAGLSSDELGRVDRGAFESLGIGLALGISGKNLIVLRANHELERLPVEGKGYGSRQVVGCPEIDQPFVVVSSDGARGDAVVGRHTVAWLPYDADTTTSEWIAPTRIESCLALEGGSLLVVCGQELWVLERYLCQ